MNIASLLQSGILTQVFSQLTPDEQAKIKNILPQILAGAVKGAIAGIPGGQAGIEAGAISGALAAGIAALEAK